ncbi:hypothetical protein GeomeDRAFT_0707 [Geobacter metallireducens RCH3]|nr:hypothetical protein GeomeDRAFT_0707 [Geobacter metallireducens RCH3]
MSRRNLARRLKDCITLATNWANTVMLWGKWTEDVPQLSLPELNMAILCIYRAYREKCYLP